MNGLKGLLRGQLRKLVGLTSIVAIGLIALTSLTMQEDEENSNDSDFFQRTRVIQEVVINGIVPDMNVNYTIEASSLLQFPEKGHSDLIEPRVLQIDAKGFTRTLAANNGRYYEDSQEMSLTGDVTISLVNSDDVKIFDSTTTNLTFQLGDMGQ
ncbi:MAG: LPS export ABC transporter periplasmic protein LptC [Acidiferrobacterales bacterium]|nr:LPS export ABC transporter periplasmic protein LptC [Acidiferrobacterales bacterium]